MRTKIQCERYSEKRIKEILDNIFKGLVQLDNEFKVYSENYKDELELQYGDKE
jgi:hypothetical protein